MPEKTQPKEAPSKGSRLVEKYRKSLNAMSEEDRRRNFREGMAVIYGGIVPAHAGRRR